MNFGVLNLLLNAKSKADVEKALNIVFTSRFETSKVFINFQVLAVLVNRAFTVILDMRWIFTYIIFLGVN